MAPDQRGEVGDIVVADVHSVQPDLANGFLHVDGVPMHDGIESEAKGAKLFFLPLLERTPDFAAFAMMNAPAEAMAQFSMVELGQVNEARKTQHIFLAKYLCGSRHFSNMFCEAREAVA